MYTSCEVNTLIAEYCANSHQPVLVIYTLLTNGVTKFLYPWALGVHIRKVTLVHVTIINNDIMFLSEVATVPSQSKPDKYVGIYYCMLHGTVYGI